MHITKSEISMRIWRSFLSVALQDAFVVIPEIPHGDISMHNKRADSSTLTMDIEFWEQILFLLRDLLPNMNLIQDSIDLASVKNH